MVAAKDLKYLWIGLACWVGTLAAGIANKMDVLREAVQWQSRKMLEVDWD